jgi:hypothetical protein
VKRIEVDMQETESKMIVWRLQGNCATKTVVRPWLRQSEVKLVVSKCESKPRRSHDLRRMTIGPVKGAMRTRLSHNR